ncbi:MAG: hypothetical protein MPF33_02525 [Candidatus Aramenus sp.]|nr:hypothetical protein [Candidatus Aramenus sp.]
MTSNLSFTLTSSPPIKRRYYFPSCSLTLSNDLSYSLLEILLSAPSKYL